MGKFEAENYYIHLGTGLYLNPKGQLVDKLPVNKPYVVDNLPLAINFPDFIKKEITNKNVQALPGIVKGVAGLAGGLGVNPKVWDILEASLNLIFNLTSVTGAAAATVNLVKLIIPGGPNQPSQLDLIHQSVDKILKMEYTGKREEVRRDVIRDWAATQGARQALNDFLLDEAPGEQAFAQINRAAEDMFNTATRLLNPGFQNLTKQQSDFVAQPWYTDQSWLASRSGAPLDPSADVARMTEPVALWDYTPYLAAIIDSVTLLIAIYQTLDPALRTTGRFRDRTKALADAMKVFGDKIGEHIVWTREWSVLDHFWRPFNSGWPVGAVDVCSGASSFKSYWLPDGVLPPSGALGNPFEEPVLPPNIAPMLAEARRVRDLNWLMVYEASGAPKVLQLAKFLTELSSIPEASETVFPVVSKTARRKRTGSQPRSTPSMPNCEQVTFTAAVYEIKRSVRINSSLQAPRRHAEEKGYWTIPYKFYVESHPGRFSGGTPLDRVEIVPGQKSVSLRAQVFDWEVKSDKILLEASPNLPKHWEQLVQDRYVKLAGTRPDLQVTVHPWSLPDAVQQDILDSISQDPDYPGVLRNVDVQQVTLDCSLVRRKGEFTARFWNRPGQANFSGVFLVIEEQVRASQQGKQVSGPILRTKVDLSMVGKELHLPKKYFDLIDMCAARTRAIIKEIEFQYRLKEAPIPRWDPAVYGNPAEWVQKTLIAQPKVLKGNLLAEARKLARGPIKIK